MSTFFGTPGICGVCVFIEQSPEYCIVYVFAILMMKTKEVQGAMKSQRKLCFKQIPEDGMESGQSK